jgi:UrcA family protein
MGFEDPFDEVLYRGTFAASTNPEIPMNTSQRYIAIATLALAASAFGPAAAVAADSDDTTIIQHVSYSDLDLTREAGAQTLYQRINSAAQRVCSPLNGRQLVEHMNQRGCVTSAVERAVRHVNEPMLTRYYLTRNPKSDLGASLTVAASKGVTP